MRKRIAAKMVAARERSRPENKKAANTCRGGKLRDPYNYFPKKVICGCGTCKKCRRRLYSITYWTIKQQGPLIVTAFIPKRQPRVCRCGECRRCRRTLYMMTVRASRKFKGTRMHWLDLKAAYIAKDEAKLTLFEQEIYLATKNLVTAYAVSY